jgi:hypothetical protein
LDCFIERHNAKEEEEAESSGLGSATNETSKEKDENNKGQKRIEEEQRSYVCVHASKHLLTMSPIKPWTAGSTSLDFLCSRSSVAAPENREKERKRENERKSPKKE